MKTISKIFLLAIGLSLYSCDDIIEEDITNDTVQIIAPAANDSIESNVVSFQWNALKGADKYRIQVYSSNQTLSLDSLVTQTRFTHQLSGGNYQWRVRGENSAYESAYSFPMNFTLIESDDLTDQQVILSRPSDDSYTKSTSSVNFSWERLHAAEQYTIEVVNESTSETVYPAADITATSLSVPATAFASEGQYSWKVMASNLSNSTSTQFSSRIFYVDRTIPSTPVNVAPANNLTQVSGQQISFTWSQSLDGGVVQSPLTYVVEYASNSSFTGVQSSPPLTATSWSLAFNTTGDYYWRVKATDKAGNISTYSQYFKFTIN